MPKNEFMPGKDAEFLVWHDQLKAAATTLGTALGITADDLTEIGEDNTAAHDKVNTAATATTAAQTANGEKNDTLTAIKARVRLFAKRVKGHRAYTETKGKQLGIVGSGDSTDMTQAQPTLVGTALGQGQAEIAFNKMLADGVNLYYQDAAQNWVFLARDTQSPYVDNRPLAVAGKPEMRTYRAKFVINDQETGYESDAITVAVTP